MLVSVDPLLHRMEALPEAGCYAAYFILDGGTERSVVMKMDASVEGGVLVPEANMVPGWSITSESFGAVLGAVRAFDYARERIDGVAAVLRDVPGGWDVSIGNIVLGAAGQPCCVAHGDLDLAQAATYACPACGAKALYGG